MRRLALGLALALCNLAAAGEAIFLKTGEEYVGRLLGITDRRLTAAIAGKRRFFELDDIQRVEFQKPRLLDDVATASQLPDRVAFFSESLRPKTADLRRRFPQAAYVVLWDETDITLGARGAWEIKRFEASRILHPRGAGSAARSLTYFPDRQQAEIIFAITVGPDGKVSRVSDSAIKDEALHARVPAYDFQHRLRFNLKNAVPGATLFLATATRGRATLLCPMVLDKVFAGREPALRRIVRLAVPKSLRGRVAIAELNGLKPKADGLWELRNTPQVLPEPLMPPLRAFAPRLVVAWPKTTWKDLAAEITERARVRGRIEIHDSSPQGIYRHVRTQVRAEDVPLDALPEGPAPPAEVFERGFGNQAERALLLAALCRAAGYKATTVLVRPRTDGPLGPGAPTLRGLNAAVVRLETQGKTVWLHPDAETRGYGEVAPEVQGAMGLELERSRLVTIPPAPPEQEKLSRKVQITLSADGSALVADNYTLTGHHAAAYRDLKDKTAEGLAQWAALFVGGEYAGVDLREFTHSDFARANPTERLAFRYRIPALAQRVGDYLILTLPNVRLEVSEIGRSERRHPLSWKGTDAETLEVTITIPDGYEPYAIGERVSARSDGWRLEAGFTTRADRRIVFTDSWTRSALDAPRSAYAEYRKALIARSRLRQAVIVLKRAM